jgi:hypothetical protein
MAFMIPKLVQRLAPGGVAPTQLPPDIMSYISGPTAAIASGARQAVYATERAVKSSSVPRFLWPLLALLGIFIVGLLICSSRGPAKNMAFNAEEQVRLASQKAAAALAALKPGFTMPDLLVALNLEIINFSTGSARCNRSYSGFLFSTQECQPGFPECAGQNQRLHYFLDHKQLGR